MYLGFLKTASVQAPSVRKLLPRRALLAGAGARGACALAMEPSSTGPASLPAVLEDRLGAEVREGVRTLDGLGAAAPREAAALDELSRLNQLAQQRQAARWWG